MKLTFNVTLTARDKDGNITGVREGSNAIANGDPDSAGIENGFIFALVKLFDTAGTFASWYNKLDFITTMELGTGTPGNDGLGTPYTSPNTQESIDYDINSIDKSTPGAPVFTATTVYGPDAPYNVEMSGITEVVMLNDSDEVFAYKSFSAMSKSALGTLTIVWTLTLSTT